MIYAYYFLLLRGTWGLVTHLYRQIPMVCGTSSHRYLITMYKWQKTVSSHFLGKTDRKVRQFTGARVKRTAAWEDLECTRHCHKIEITEPEKDKNKQENKFSVIERSVRGEDFAILQPDGELIAYTSRRSGDTQLWVTDGKSSQQLTHFPMDTYIYGIDWGADGKSILVNANSELTQVFLDSKQKFFPLEYPVVQLFQWDSESNSALLLIRIKGILKLGELNLSTFETQIIDDNNVNWALKSENGHGNTN